MRTFQSRAHFLIAAFLFLMVVAEDVAARSYYRTRLPRPTIRDIAYGSDPKQTINFWRCQQGANRPLLVYFAGSTRAGASKDHIRADVVKACLHAGINVAAVDTRMTYLKDGHEGILDAARALQHLRHHAEKLRFDPTKIAGYGNSAGGTVALWLAVHDDMAVPASKDPIATQSTRLSCAVAFNAPTTLLPDEMRRIAGDVVLNHGFIPRLFQVQSFEELNAPELSKWVRAFSPAEHIDRNDPPIGLNYRLSVVSLHGNFATVQAIQSPAFGEHLVERLKEARVIHYLNLYNQGRDNTLKPMIEFLQQHLTVKENEIMTRADVTGR